MGQQPEHAGIDGGPVAKDRRKWERYGSSMATVTVITPGGAREMRVVDASADGMGLVVDGADGLRVGERVTLDGPLGRVTAVVRFVTPQPDATVRIGVEWVE